MTCDLEGAKAEAMPLKFASWLQVIPGPDVLRAHRRWWGEGEDEAGSVAGPADSRLAVAACRPGRGRAPAATRAFTTPVLTSLVGPRRLPLGRFSQVFQTAMIKKTNWF